MEESSLPSLHTFPLGDERPPPPDRRNFSLLFRFLPSLLVVVGLNYRSPDDLAFELRKTRPSRGSPADIEVSGEERRGGEKCARSATDGKSRTTKYVIYFGFSGEIAESLAGSFFFIKRGYTIEFRFPSENRLFPSVGKKVRERARNESTKEGGKEVRSKFGRNPNSHPISCRAFTRFFFFI